MIIDRMFIAVLMLSVSGFICGTVFFLLERYAYRLAAAKTMVFANTAALFSFVLPFYLIASLIDGSEQLFRDWEIYVFEDRSRFESIAGKIQRTGIVEHLSSIWLFGVICLFLMYVCKYFYLLHRVRANKFYMEGSAWADIFNRLKAEKNVQGVKLVCCYAVFTPCSIGIRDRYVVIPASMMNAFDEEEMEFILAHELCHILHRDLPRKLLVMLLSCLFWFNPQFCFLRIKLSDWLEAAADEAVAAGFDFKKRLRYSRLIAKVMELEREGSMAAGFSAGFRGEAKKNIRRAKKIMQKKEISGVRGRAAVVFAVLLSLIPGNAAAKEADAPINQMFSKNAAVAKSSDVEIIETSDFVLDDIDIGIGEHAAPADVSGFAAFDMCNTETITYEIIYDIDSKTVFYEEPPQAEPMHTHEKKYITLKEHEKYKDGSCKTTYYEATKCISCGQTWKGNEISAVTQTVCRH